MAELRDLEIDFSVEIVNLEVRLNVSKNNFADDVTLTVNDSGSTDSEFATGLRLAPAGKYATPIFAWTGGALVGDEDWDFQFDFLSSDNTEKLSYSFSLYVPSSGRVGFEAKIKGTSTKTL